jgi:PRTRC genetic system protein B
MNALTEKLTDNYLPKLAIVVYASGESWSNSYIESHIINEGGQLLAGKPLQQDTIQGIVDVFFDDRKNRTQIGGLIPQNLLSFEILPGGHTRMVWYRAAEQRVLHFVPALNITSGEAWVPAMLYVANERSLSVYALPSNERPDEETKLLNAPFHNVSNANVCLGSAKVKKPDKNYSSIMKYWEDMFWLSEFTHLANSISPIKGNLNVTWQTMIDNPDWTWEYLGEFIESGKTLKKLL